MDCVINPLTGRAVKINSVAGRRALKYNSKNNLKASHDCLTNPKTGRAVSKNSAIGRRLMKQFKDNENYEPTMPSAPSFSPMSKSQKMPSFKSTTPGEILAIKDKSKTPPAPKKKKYDFGGFKTPPRYYNTPPKNTSDPKDTGANEKIKSKRKGMIKSPVAKEATPKPKTPIPEPPPKIKTPTPEPAPEPSFKAKTASIYEPETKPDEVNIFIDEEDADTECYTLDCRIKDYTRIKKHLNKINAGECLDVVNINGRNYFTLQNILMLDKQIGSKSVYASVYLSFVKQEKGLYVATKTSKKYDFSFREIEVAEKITNLILKPKFNKHFPLIYTSHICDDTDDHKSLVIVNELANGDLKMILQNKDFYKSADVLDKLYNLLVQCIISLGTFHKFLNYYHKDAHWGNFLYQRNDEEGFYKYENNKEPFYLASCDYNIMLHDFAFAVPLADSKMSDGLINYQGCIADILNITYAFLPKFGGYKGWAVKMNPFIKSTDPKTQEYLKNISDLQKELNDMWIFAYKNSGYNDKNYDFDLILNLLKKYIPKHILNDKPLKGSLINDRVYKTGLGINEEYIKSREETKRLDAEFEKKLQDEGWYDMTEEERIKRREEKAYKRRRPFKPKNKTPIPEPPPKPKSKTPKPKSKTPIPEPPPKPKSKTPKPKSKTPIPEPAPKPKNNNNNLETLKIVGTFIKDTEEYLKSKSKRAFNDLIKKYNNKEYISEVIGAQIFGDFYPTPQKCLDHAYGDMPEYFADDEVFLEPTAGLGSIVYWLLNKKVKGKIITTDFDANLHIYLKNNFEKFNNVDVIPHEKSDYLKLENNFVGYKPTVIFLNPPFSKGNDKRYYLNFLYKALYDLKNSKSRYNERQLFFISPQLTKDEKDGRQINLGDDIEMSPNKKKEIMKMLNIDEEEFYNISPMQMMRIKTCKEFAGTNIEAVFYHAIIYV